MKKLICLTMVCCILAALSACGASASPVRETEVDEEAVSNVRPVHYDEGSSYGISYVIEGPAPVNNRHGNKFHPADMVIVLADDDMLKAELIGTFEQKYGPKDDRKLGRGAAIEFTNKSQDDLLISLADTFVGTKEMTAVNLGCPNKCDAGQTIQMNFILYTESDAGEQAIESLEEVYRLRGNINTRRFVDDDNITDSIDHPFSVSGEPEPETTAPRILREFDPIVISPNENKVIRFDDPILLLDNEYLKVEIIEFYQERVNWVDEKGSRMEKGIVVKTTNKHDRELSVSLEDIYIGEKEIKLCMNDGSISPEPGRATSNGFYVWEHAGHDDNALEDINELFHLEGNIIVKEYVEDHHVEKLGEYSFYIS